MDKLKPCRACGFRPTVCALTDSYNRIYGYVIRCCGSVTEMMNKRKDAIALWNRLASNTKLEASNVE